MNTAVIYENGHEPEFILYTTNPIISLGIYNAHVQATYKVKNRRVWLGGNAQESDEPTYPMGEYCWILNMQQYIEWLKVNREFSRKPMPSKEHRDKYWPKTREVLK